jgi:hypothetical protein
MELNDPSSPSASTVSEVGANGRPMSSQPAKVGEPAEMGTSAEAEEFRATAFPTHEVNLGAFESQGRP